LTLEAKSINTSDIQQSKKKFAYGSRIL